MRLRRDVVVPLAVALLAALLPAQASKAQREFVEEVDTPKKANIDDVDLDAPDPAEKPMDPKATDPKATDPKATDPKATDPKATDPKAAEPGAGTDAPDAGPAATGDVPSTTPPPGTEPGGVYVQETSWDALLEKWETRAAIVRKGEVARAKAKLADVHQALLDFGAQGVPGGFQATSAAVALLREARKAIDDGSMQEAEALVDAAELAAPDLVDVHAQRAVLKWKNGDAGAALQSVVAGAQAFFRDPVSLSQIAARGLALVGVVLVLVLALAALLMGLPALRYLSFDLLQALPKGAHGGQVLALVVMAALAPLVVGAGPVFGSLWILTLAWLYLEGRKRVVVALLAVACVGLPSGIDAISRLIAYPGSRSERAARALFDADGERERVLLKKRVPGELDVFEQAALAYAAKREGRLDEAAQRLNDLLQKNDLAWLHGEAGVVAALQDKEEPALAELGKALAADETAYAAAFNASVIHYRGGRSDKATAAVGPLTARAPALLAAFRQTTYREADVAVGHNRAYVDVYPHTIDVVKAGLEPSPDSIAVADTLSRVLLRGESGTRAMGFLGAFPLLWLVLLAARKKIAPAQACTRCGDPASKRVDGKDVPDGTCAQCFHAFVSTRSRIDAGVKLRKELAISRRRTRLSRTTIGLGVLFPGAGHLFAGAAVRGLVFTLLYGGGLSLLYLVSGFLPMPRLGGALPDNALLIVVGVVVAAVWILGVRSSFVVAGDMGGRGRR
jgi:tetratricopeptide (TPR) repeat protein